MLFPEKVASVVFDVLLINAVFWSSKPNLMPILFTFWVPFLGGGCSDHIRCTFHTHHHHHSSSYQALRNCENMLWLILVFVSHFLSEISNIDIVNICTNITIHMHQFLSPFVIDKGRIKVIQRFCDIVSSRQTPCCRVLIDLLFFFRSYNHCLGKGDFWQAAVEQRSL